MIVRGIFEASEPIVCDHPERAVLIVEHRGETLRQRGAAKIVAAVPVGSPETCREFEDESGRSGVRELVARAAQPELSSVRPHLGRACGIKFDTIL
jgi:hypothetical protein